MDERGGVLFTDGITQRLVYVLNHIYFTNNCAPPCLPC